MPEFQLPRETIAATFYSPWEADCEAIRGGYAFYVRKDYFETADDLGMAFHIMATVGNNESVCWRDWTIQKGLH